MMELFGNMDKDVVIGELESILSDLKDSPKDKVGVTLKSRTLGDSVDGLSVTLDYDTQFGDIEITLD